MPLDELIGLPPWTQRYSYNVSPNYVSPQNLQGFQARAPRSHRRVIIADVERILKANEIRKWEYFVRETLNDCSKKFIDVVTFKEPFTTNFAATETIQEWTVPEGVTEITVNGVGGQGGKNGFNLLVGGRGANLTGTFDVNPGDEISIIVGGQGPTNSEANQFDGGGPGGGGTIIYIDGAPQPLIAAGGGGGAASTSVWPFPPGATGNGVDASLGTAGEPDESNTEVGGDNGTNAPMSDGGGNGYFAIIADPIGNKIQDPAFADYPRGGWGGGGHPAGRDSSSQYFPNGGGGGGGYSGGGARRFTNNDATAAVGGGGGGSFNGGTNQNNFVDDTGLGNGSASIAYNVSSANVRIVDGAYDVSFIGDRGFRVRCRLEIFV